MAIQSFQLDPNAAAYTDDEIVAKVNSGSISIVRSDAIDGTALGACDADDLAESTTKKWAGATGADFVITSDTLDEITAGTTNIHYTSGEGNKLSGIDTGAEVNPADLAELDATANTKLTNIEENATVDQTGDEIVTAIDAGSSAITREGALSQDDLNLVKSNALSGEFYVRNIQRDTDGKLDVEYDDTPA